MQQQGLRLVFFIFGLCLPLWFSSLPSTKALLGALACGIFFLAYSRMHIFVPRIPLSAYSGLKCLGFLLTGFALSAIHLNIILNKQLPDELEGLDLEVLIRVTDLPEVTGTSTRFRAKIVQHYSHTLDWRESIRLSWYHAPDLKVGDSWRLNVRLKRPRGFANPHGFDYQAWMLSHGLFASGYVRSKSNNQKLAESQTLYSDLSFSALRETFALGLFANSNLTYAGFMRALLLGDKSHVSSTEWDVLQRTGTIHLMAISGLHIGLIASLGFLLGKLLGRMLVLVWGSRLSIFWFGPGFSLLFSFIYAGMAGFSIPTQRALIFVFCINVALVLGRRINYFHALGICSAAVILFDPFAPLSAGFYLSFSAVAILFYCFLGRSHFFVNDKGTKKYSALRTFLSAQFVLFIGLFLPLSLLNMPVSATGMLANTIAIPLVSTLVVPGIFFAALTSVLNPEWANTILHLVDFVFGLLWQYLEYLASFEFSIFYFSTKNVIAAVAGCCLALLCLFPRGAGIKMLCVPLLLIYFFSGQSRKEDFSLTALDVGQGLAVYLEWPQGNMLYDTGARYSGNFDMGSRIIAPWLRYSGVKRLDYLLISHGDNDHAGGLQGVLDHVAVDKLVLGESVRALAHGEGQQAVKSKCRAGSLYKNDELEITVLWPREQASNKMNISSVESGTRAGSSGFSSNNSSCVVLVTFRGFTILLSGDIEKPVENALLESGTLPRNIDLLVAPHHGSATSSSAAFVAHLKPARVIFSVAYKNRYHHPSVAVVETYNEFGTSIYRTDLDGAITYTIGQPGQQEKIHLERRDKLRLWYW